MMITSDFVVRLKKLINAVLLLMLLTLSAHANKKQIIIAQDGSGNFKTIADAIAAVPDSNASEIVLLVKNGIYKEKLNIPKAKTHITLLGEDVYKTIITYDDYASKKDSFGKDIGTSGSRSVYVQCNDLKAENITFENSSGPVGQALALSVGGDRVFFKNCRFLGFQDTIYTFGNTNRQYFYQCYIEGTVDFIFGAATAVFEKCNIYCKKKGYITAASTAEGQKFGYIFFNCKISGDAPENSFYLGRPWRPNANVVFIKCEMPKLIKPEGWHNWGKETNEKTVFYAEYKNKGAGYQPEKRVSWSKQLSKAEAKEYSVKNVLGDWKPRQ